MNIETLKESMPEYANDIKFNISSLLSSEVNSDLSPQQIAGVALACAYATKSISLMNVIQEFVKPLLDQKFINAAKAAATIMAMNNVYYRFIHFVEDLEIMKMPAKLRMNFIANPGISKIDFELYCLAVSAINGCGACMRAHTKTLLKENVNKNAIQSAVKIASVICAVAQTLINEVS